MSNNVETFDFWNLIKRLSIIFIALAAEAGICYYLKLEPVYIITVLVLSIITVVVVIIWLRLNKIEKIIKNKKDKEKQ